jgi:hypothetical protein
MAVYSDKNRLKLAKWLKYAIIVSISINILAAIFLVIEYGSSEASTQIGKSFIPTLFGLVIAYAVYEKLQKPDDDNWRKLAEILGSIQVFFIFLIALFFLGVLVFGIFTGIASCPTGEFKGDDGVCYPNGTVKCNCGGHMYCEADGECINDKWTEKCPTGYFRGDNGACYKEGLVKCNCGGFSYCEADGECYNNQWLEKCEIGEFRGDDGVCYPIGSVKCNCGRYTYCVPGGECINNVWSVKCPIGYFRGDDGACYPPGTVKCNCGGYTYCVAGGKCCNGQWIMCPSGTYLGSDCFCYR